mmetsp:Transcript_59087/g.162066  ORF Transcript_59087/g.162066 Transcript_59087/m.162066 type:complete len:270 (-) Transcript_59087:446-1255(-)
MSNVISSPASSRSPHTFAIICPYHAPPRHNSFTEPLIHHHGNNTDPATERKQNCRHQRASRAATKPWIGIPACAKTPVTPVAVLAGRSICSSIFLPVGCFANDTSAARKASASSKCPDGPACRANTSATSGSFSASSVSASVAAGEAVEPLGAVESSCGCSIEGGTDGSEAGNAFDSLLAVNSKFVDRVGMPDNDEKNSTDDCLRIVTAGGEAGTGPCGPASSPSSITASGDITLPLLVLCKSVLSPAAPSLSPVLLVSPIACCRLLES